jgi:hypothetical protein
MAERYTDRIKTYCDANGIAIPAGFYRHSASRYVAVDYGYRPARLVAKTWFKQEDMIYYATHLAAGKTLRFLDFKERRELRFNEGHELEQGESF